MKGHSARKVLAGFETNFASVILMVGMLTSEILFPDLVLPLIFCDFREVSYSLFKKKILLVRK